MKKLILLFLFIVVVLSSCQTVGKASYSGSGASSTNSLNGTLVVTTNVPGSFLLAVGTSNYRPVNSPFTISRAAEQNVTVIIVKPDYEVFFQDWVNILPGRTTRVYANLRPKGVYVTSTPTPVRVFVNRLSRGLTPINLTNVSIGEVIGIFESGYVEVNYPISNASNVHFNLVPYLTPTPVRYRIYATSNPSRANVYVNGNRQSGLTPRKFEVLGQGINNITFVKSGYLDETKMVTLVPNQTVNVSATLTLINGSIYATSNPSTAWIYVDNILKGATPRTIDRLYPGHRYVTFVRRGYANQTLLVYLYQGRTSNVTANLTLLGQTNNATNATNSTPSCTAGPTGTKFCKLINDYWYSVPEYNNTNCTRYNNTYAKEGCGTAASSCQNGICCREGPANSYCSGNNFINMTRNSCTGAISTNTQYCSQLNSSLTRQPLTCGNRTSGRDWILGPQCVTACTPGSELVKCDRYNLNTSYTKYICYNDGYDYNYTRIVVNSCPTGTSCAFWYNYSGSYYDYYGRNYNYNTSYGTCR